MNIGFLCEVINWENENFYQIRDELLDSWNFSHGIISCCFCSATRRRQAGYVGHATRRDHYRAGDGKTIERADGIYQRSALQ